VAVKVDCTKTLVAVLPTKIPVAVAPATAAVAVPDTNVRDAVTSVFPIVTVQLAVLRDAERFTSVSTVPLVTPDAMTTEAVEEIKVCVCVEATLMPTEVDDANTAVAV